MYLISHDYYFTTRYFEGDTKRIQLNLYKGPWASLDLGNPIIR